MQTLLAGVVEVSAEDESRDETGCGCSPSTNPPHTVLQPRQERERERETWENCNKTVKNYQVITPQRLKKRSSGVDSQLTLSVPRSPHSSLSSSPNETCRQLPSP